jgi:hypothetical protein
MAGKLAKWPQNIPTSSIALQNFQNWYFWFENIASGNPELEIFLAILCRPDVIGKSNDRDFCFQFKTRNSTVSILN